MLKMLNTNWMRIAVIALQWKRLDRRAPFCIAEKKEGGKGLFLKNQKNCHWSYPIDLYSIKRSNPIPNPWSVFMRAALPQRLRSKESGVRVWHWVAYMKSHYNFQHFDSSGNLKLPIELLSLLRLLQKSIVDISIRNFSIIRRKWYKWGLYYCQPKVRCYRYQQTFNHQLN